MLTKNEEKLIKSLHRKKGRKETGFCLLEGQKLIDVAGDAVERVFHPNDSERYDDLVTTETPQPIAAIAKIPEWTLNDVKAKDRIVVLDGVQDPGNVGAILRLCLAFKAGLVLIESADPTSPKVIRSSAGAMFQTPWASIPREGAEDVIASLGAYVLRLEKRDGSTDLREVAGKKGENVILIAGSEGNGIQLDYEAMSVHIGHDETLESLNVANSIAIALHQFSG
jgi:RNA methyltransferase, TrmH family